MKELIENEKSIEDLAALVEEKDEEITLVMQRLIGLAKPADRVANLKREVVRIPAELKLREEGIDAEGHCDSRSEEDIFC